MTQRDRGKDDKPRRTRIYRHRMLDGTRWDAFTPRDDDIILCSPYKAGTTWMQTMCALLIFQSPEFPAPLSKLSPWLEAPYGPIAEVLERLEIQKNRRIIKSHTPLDGLPYFEHLPYLFIARDPRDIFISFTNHLANQDSDMRMMSGLTPWPQDEIPKDPCEFFRKWMTTSAIEGEEDGWPAWSVLKQAETFWRYRDCPNIHLFHYADLLADLDGQMRRLAAILDIPVDEAIWSDLVNAAGFESMKQRAAMLVPSGGRAWKDPAAFFAKGTHGRWQGILGSEELELYRQAMAERIPPDLAEWLENGGSIGR